MCFRIADRELALPIARTKQYGAWLKAGCCWIVSTRVIVGLHCDPSSESESSYRSWSEFRGCAITSGSSVMVRVWARRVRVRSGAAHRRLCAHLLLCRQRLPPASPDPRHPHRRVRPTFLEPDLCHDLAVENACPRVASCSVICDPSISSRVLCLVSLIRAAWSRLRLCPCYRRPQTLNPSISPASWLDCTGLH